MKNIEPKDFEFIGIFFQHIGFEENFHGEKEEIFVSEYDEIINVMEEKNYKWNPIYGENVPEIREWMNCTICGHRMHNGSAFVNIKTNEIHVIGNDCSIKLKMMDKSLFNYKKRVAQNKMLFKKGLEKYNFEESLFSRDHYILESLKSNLTKYNKLSEKQVELVYKINKQLDEMEIENEKREKHEEEISSKRKTAVSGKNVIVNGTILSTKVKEDMYGMTHKMLLETEDYWKLWVSVPIKLEEENWNKIIGTKISIKCTVTPSSNDKFFAFGKRPRLLNVFN